MPNEFPQVWFDTFLTPAVAAPVQRELEFIQSYLPRPDYPRLIDVPCGIGRHAGPLNDLGYEVVGIDRSQPAITMARKQYPEVDFRVMDMFDLGRIGETFDGLLCLWHSFGYGTADENVELLRDMRSVLRPGGRLLMDVYNREAAARLPQEALEERTGRTVHTKRSWSASRLRVELRYSDSDLRDVHEWELYNPDEFREMAESVGLDVIIMCAWFDSGTSPSVDHLRMQVLLERPA